MMVPGLARRGPHAEESTLVTKSVLFIARRNTEDRRALCMCRALSHSASHPQSQPVMFREANAAGATSHFFLRLKSATRMTAATAMPAAVSIVVFFFFALISSSISIAFLPMRHVSS